MAEAGKSGHVALTSLDATALLLTALIGSVTPIAVRLAVAGDAAAGRPGFPPLLGGSLRFGIAGLILLAFLTARGKLRAISRSDWLRVLMLAVVAVPVNQFGYWQGVNLANASHGAIIYAATPIIVTLLTCAIGVERMSMAPLAGALLATAGVLVILLQSGLTLSRGFLTGDLLLLLGVSTWSAYLVFSRPLTRKYGSLSSQTWVFLAGTALSLPFSVSAALKLNWAAVAPRAWFGLGYLSVMVAGALFFLLNWLMARQPPSRVATFSNAAYPLTIVWTSLFGGSREKLSAWFVGGSILLLSGMLVTLLRKTPGQPVPEESSPVAIPADLETMAASGRENP